MTRPDPDDFPRDWRQLLAAYADGELDVLKSAEVRTWLGEHPDGYSQLVEQRSLSPSNTPFWDAVRPTMPDVATWATVWNRIDAGLDAPTVRLRMRSRGPWWRRGLLAVIAATPFTAAAAAVVAIYVPDRPVPVSSTPLEESAADEVFQVAGAGDVEILSIRDADVPQLVVGEPPFNQAMLLVAAGDVRVDDVQPANDGMIPAMVVGGNDAPLIFAPIPR
jgi:hypothetical protein